TAGELHTNESKVTGEGEISGKGVEDKDPWNGLPPKITILKKDAETGEVLKGAVFQLWRESNDTPGLQRTGEEADTKVGTACSTSDEGVCDYTAKEGTYYLEELAVPEGYLLPDEPVFGPYEVTKSTTELKVTLFNKPGEHDKKGKKGNSPH
ncbi:prealbumin-like fold domain-containing protein, partial [Streptomyces sp. NPDC006879]|uniref:prealbumin-like fold domain-containing protein n=1 Tax=Streptomyces sp. NPDC006879 TaxID=3364767 RepID=UPI0036A7EDE2